MLKPAFSTFYHEKGIQPFLQKFPCSTGATVVILSHIYTPYPLKIILPSSISSKYFCSTQVCLVDKLPFVRTITCGFFICMEEQKTIKIFGSEKLTGSGIKRSSQLKTKYALQYVELFNRCSSFFFFFFIPEGCPNAKTMLKRTLFSYT